MSGPRLSIIPAGAVTDRSLEPRDLQVLCLLGRHINKAGWCVRSQVRMAAELDCGRSSVQRSLDRLYQAGWVERKQRSAVAEDGEEAGRPSVSHAYRVRLDRDDFAFETATKELAESHAETASQETDCPPVGTPSDSDATSENPPQDTQPNGHPGAQPYVGTGAQPYVGTNNDPLERPHLERERDARARDRKARGLVDFEARWPSAAADDRQRTAYAWEGLTEVEEEAAIGGIGPFVENLKRLGRKGVPAGWKYLEEKRWTLLETKNPATPAVAKLPAGSPEAKAVGVLYTIAGKAHVLFAAFMRAGDGGLYYRGEITQRLLALASAPTSDQWVTLDHQQAWAWNEMIAEFITLRVWSRLAEGSRAPWPYPPSKTGKIYATGPPDALMTADDMATDF